MGGKQAKIGNKDYGLGGEIDNFEAGSYKCNKFVNDAFEKGAGVEFTDRAWYSDDPPMANQIADPKFNMKNYPVVKGEPKPGDIVAFPTPGGTGHVAIYAGEGQELQGGKKSASKSSYEEMKNSHKGKVTIRRYTK